MRVEERDPHRLFLSFAECNDSNVKVFAPLFSKSGWVWVKPTVLNYHCPSVGKKNGAGKKCWPK